MLEYLKNRNMGALLLAGMSCVMVGCSDDDEPVVVEITEADVAEMIATSISAQDGGLATDIQHLFMDLGEGVGCGEELEDEESFQVLGSRTYTLDYSYQFTTGCDPFGQIDRVDYYYKVNREADLYNVNVTDSAVGDWEFTYSSGNYEVEGQYLYQGIEQIKDSEDTYSSSTCYLADELLLNSS